MKSEAPPLADAGPPSITALSALLSRRRLARVAGYSSAQLVVQGAGFVAGVILARVLPQAEYGHYTLTIAMIGLGAVLFDLGLGSAVLAHGGPHHGAPRMLAGLLGDAFGLQRRLVAALALPLAVVMAWMLHGHGMPAGAGAGLLVLALAGSWLSARNGVWLAVARLRGELALQQQLELGVNLGRAVAIAAAAMVYVDAVVAVALAVLTSAVMQALLMRHHGRVLGSLAGAADGRFSAGLAGFVKRQAPNSLYYCVNGQIAVWLVGWFGSVERVAEVGALGRLALLFAMAGSLVAAFVQPYFARPRRPAELVQAFVAVNALAAFGSVLLVAGAIVAPQALLWVLGPTYAGLRSEAAWMVGTSTLAAWSGAVYAMGAARGWVVPGAWVIPVGVASVAAGALMFDCGTVRGAFQLNALVAAATALLVLVWVTARLRQHVRQAAPGVAS